MAISSLLGRMEKTGIVAIVRGISGGGIVQVAEALYDGGIRAIEVTCNTPGHLEMISVLREALDGRMAIGAGTVLSAAAVKEVAAAGAEFILAPNLDASVMEAAHAAACPAIPGAATPTEIMAAVKMGAAAVKLFPAGALGAHYLRQIRGPLDDVRLMPVGGVGLSNIPDFIRAGAFAFGIGSELVDQSLINSGKFAALTAKARLFTAAVADARGEGKHE